MRAEGKASREKGGDRETESVRETDSLTDAEETEKHKQTTETEIQNTQTDIPWMQFLVVSVFSRAGMRKEAVLPVPFLALAKISRPRRAIGIASSWMGEGRSKPFS